MTIPLSMILYPRVTAVVAGQQTQIQQEQTNSEQNLETVQQITPPPPRINLILTPTLVQLPAKATPLMTKPVHSTTAVAAAGTSGSQAQTWYTVNRRMRTTTAGRGSGQERTAVAEFSRPVRNPTDADKRIVFPRAAGTGAF